MGGRGEKVERKLDGEDICRDGKKRRIKKRRRMEVAVEDLKIKKKDERVLMVEVEKVEILMRMTLTKSGGGKGRHKKKTVFFLQKNSERGGEGSRRIRNFLIRKN